MENEKPVFIPPVVLEDFTDFRQYARDAALVLYYPEYFQSPFLDEQKRIRRLTLTAVGVRIHGVPLSFKYSIDYNELANPSRAFSDQVTEIDTIMTEMVESLGYRGNLVRGSLDTQPSIGEALSMKMF